MILFLNCSALVPLAQNTAVLQNNADEIEQEARSLEKIWTEDAVRQASELFLKAADRWEEKKEFQKSAECLRRSVKMKLMLAEEPSAPDLLKKSLDFDQKSRHSEGQAETLAYLTIVNLNLGDNIKAGIYLDRALKLAGKLKNPAISGRVFFAAGSYSYSKRDFPAMVAEHGKATDFFLKAGDKTGEAEASIELAYGHIINNNRQRGRDCAQKALDIAREIGDARLRVLALIALGDAHQRMGEWQAGLKAFTEAENLFPENLNLFEKAALYNRLAFYNLAYNDLNQAKKYFQKSFALFDRIGNSEGRSETLTELGQLAALEGNSNEAMRYFNQSKKIAVEFNDPLTLSVLDLKIGETFYNSGELSAAEKSFSDSLSYYKKIGIDYRIAEVEEKLGLIFEREKKYSKAREKYSIALSLNKKVLGRFAQAQNLYNLARLDNLENRKFFALKNIQESIELTESSQGETANSQLRKNFISNVFARYELYINLLMKMNGEPPNENYALQALRIAEKSRARMIYENLALSEANFMKDANPEMIEREKEIRRLLNAKADALTALLSRDTDKSEVDKISGEINELENRLEEIKAELKQNSPVYSAIKNPAPFDVGEFQKNVLDDDSLLLEFSFGKEKSYLWLVGKTEVSSYILPPREQIESKIQTLRELLASREMLKDEPIEAYQARIKKAEADYWTTANELSRDLFGQVAAKFGEKRLIVVPDGKLGYFPVSALPLPDSNKNEPILLTNEIVYEPSASTLSILTNSGKQNNPAAKSLLIFSDPVFTEKDSRLSAKSENDLSNQTASGENFRFVESLNSLVRLGASKTEADSIVDILGNSNADSFTGFAANRQKLLDVNAAEYTILHFATHGLIDENRPELSGIVLSRFDESGRKLDEFFRLHDIYGMNLNSDLVVLSACGTGMGKEIRGEGLMSLNNAFLSVGAKTVMASLWKVEDQATLELMKNFYAAMANEKLTPSQALRKAQIKMWRSYRYRSPFYWAAFTVQGDYRNVPDIENNSGVWKYFLPLPLVLFLGTYFGIRIIRRRNRK